MLTDLIIQGDWSEYNERKRRHIDRFLFSCDEDWEIEYLVNKIREHGNWSQEQVRQAIMFACCEELTPRPRGSFIRCVLRMLD